MDRKKLIMIPGTLCNEDLFKQQHEGLSDLFDCFTASNNSADSLKRIANNILKTYTGSFLLLGLSYGGIIAFEILRQAPERVDGLILLNTNYKKPSNKTQQAQQRFLGMAYLGILDVAIQEELTDAMLYYQNQKNKKLRNIILNMGLQVGINGFHNQIKAQLNRPDSSKDLPKIKCPTLIITGKEDNVCPVDLHEEMAKMIPNATLKIINQCGHLSTLEKPKEVNNIIKKWYQSIIKNES